MHTRLPPFPAGRRLSGRSLRSVGLRRRSPPCTARCLLWRKDGTSIPVEYVTPRSTRRARWQGPWSSSATSITERLEAELHVEESQERFLQLAEHIREVFWITDRPRPECSISVPGYEVWGRSCESLYAMQIVDGRIIRTDRLQFTGRSRIAAGKFQGVQ